MLTIPAFLFTIASVLASVWWACENEPPPETEQGRISVSGIQGRGITVEI